MRTDVPVVKQVSAVGPDDPVFDSFLLLGPVVVVLAAATGRNVATTALAAGYLAAFALYVVYRAADYRPGRSV